MQGNALGLGLILFMFSSLSWATPIKTYYFQTDLTSIQLSCDDAFVNLDRFYRFDDQFQKQAYGGLAWAWRCFGDERDFKFSFIVEAREQDFVDEVEAFVASHQDHEVGGVKITLQELKPTFSARIWLIKEDAYQSSEILKKEYSKVDIPAANLGSLFAYRDHLAEKWGANDNIFSNALPDLEKIVGAEAVEGLKPYLKETNVLKLELWVDSPNPEIYPYPLATVYTLFYCKTEGCYAK